MPKVVNEKKDEKNTFKKKSDNKQVGALIQTITSFSKPIIFIGNKAVDKINILEYMRYNMIIILQNGKL